MDTGSILLEAQQITKTFPLPSGGQQTVLEGVSLQVNAGEVVALLGRSGSGKSTLLRILAGLIEPTTGVVRRNGVDLEGPNPDVAMVFQSFALLPWITVQENAELGLIARGADRDTAKREAVKALGMVGLEGFEGAYPKELSGGMRQRVGFARAFVIRPDVLMMDEPFSALDVLTAENLRGEISHLWEQGTFPARSIVLVTHNIEEAVLLADRIVILGANPGYIRGQLHVESPRPRDKNASRFKALVDHVYTVMTNPKAVVEDNVQIEKASRFKMLPHARSGGISGLLEILDARGGTEDLPALAEDLRLQVDDLLPAIDAAEMLGFADVAQGDVMLTEIGREFANAEVHRSHRIFKEQVLVNVPLAGTLLALLKNKRDAQVSRELVLDILDEHFSEAEAQRQFETLVDWARYAQLIDYDAGQERISLAEVRP